MNPKKLREKCRRRASKLAEQAWEAADDGNVDLAVKIIRRAVDSNPANPLLWLDQGILLRQLNDDGDAARAFEAAIYLAPDFAEAYANLAAIRARQGKLEQAVTLQREAVRHAPESQRDRNALAAYEALLAGGRDADPHGDADVQGQRAMSQDEPGPRDGTADLAARIGGMAWPEVDESLTRHGYARLPGLLDAGSCELLRTMFDDGRRFAKTVTMNKSRFGRGVYRYFAAPLPRVVEEIRSLVYPHAAELANRWQRLLARDDLYPATWPEFRNRCAAAGQTTLSPLMLRYEAGGFNAPHQDIRGAVYFPLQLVVVLSPQSAAGKHEANAFSGGEFLFCDQPESKPSDRVLVPAGLGDAVLFCTRDRLMRVGGVYGLKSVKHGLERVSAGVRFALGIPFHEFE